MNDVWRDLVHAARALAKSPAFTIVCVLSLGIGMAPVIAIQYGMRALTTPPPGVPADTLVELLTKQVGPRSESDMWSFADYVDVRDASTGLAIAGWAVGEMDVVVPDAAKTRATTMFVSSSYFRTIGVALSRGPGFQDSTDAAVVIGHEFWQRQLASDPEIVGKMLPLNGVPHVVSGVAPEQFEGHLPFQDIEVFVPLERHPSLLADASRRFDRSRMWVRIHGRLSSGVSVEQANAAVSAFTARLAKEYPATNESTAGVVLPYHPIGNLKGQNLPILIAAADILLAIPLLVVCLNISGMVQVRSAMRERELSIRQAIGASRRRLIQHQLAESVVLAVLGGALASLVLFNVPALVSWLAGQPIPAELLRALRVDVPMIAITAGLCLVTSLLFGWLPAVRFSRPRIMTVLKDDAGGGRVRAGRIHRLTSALQVAIAVPLLVLSAMSLERVRAIVGTDLGFAADELYAAPVERADVRDTLARASGVASVTVADGVPLDLRYRRETVSANALSSRVFVTRVGDGYLDTMGIPLIAGRAFTRDDGPGAPLVTVVSKTLADAFFPNGGAIGQQITFGTRAVTIVGVVADFPTAEITSRREQLLLPLAQHADVQRDSVSVTADVPVSPRLMLIARAMPGEPPAKLRAALENTIREVNADFDRREIVSGAGLRDYRVTGFLNRSASTGISGGVTLLLAALGIYGVVGLMVTMRAREIAVRVTLGASRARVIGMILFGVFKLVAPGVVAGVLLTAALVRAQGGIALSNIEPLAYVIAAAVALLTAVLAGLAPARRAASVQPMEAMKST